MAQYKSYQSVLDEALGEYAEFGFRLVETDDHLLELYFKDKIIARYYQARATIPVIREGCRNYLANTL